jgi:tetratricopeptide (TPR) repeat protein
MNGKLMGLMIFVFSLGGITLGGIALGGIASATAQVYSPHLPNIDQAHFEKEGNILFQEALQLVQIQQYPLARSRMQLATQFIPANPKAWSLLGGLYLAENKNDEALTALQKSQSLDSKDPSVWFRLGTVHFQKKDYAQSVEALQSGLAIKPNTPGALFDLGNAYLMQRNTKEAVATYEKAYAQDAKFWYPLNNMGLIRYETGDINGAIKLWKSVLAIAEKEEEPSLALATALYRKGDRAEALSLGETAIRGDRRYSDPKFLKDNLWGDRLIADSQKLIKEPSIQEILTQEVPSPQKP